MVARKQKCSAKSSRTGKPCQRWAINGSTVCQVHGGSAPQVKNAAKQRLEDLVDSAMSCLKRAIKQTGDLPTGVRASQIVLDRTGYHPKQTVEIDDPKKVLKEILGLDDNEMP